MKILTISGCSPACNCQNQPNRKYSSLACSSIAFKAEAPTVSVQVSSPSVKTSTVKPTERKMVTSQTQFKLMGICHKKAPDFSKKMAEIIGKNAPYEKGQDSPLHNSRREFAKHRWYCSGARIQFSEERNFRNLRVLVGEHLKLTGQVLKLAFSEANNYHIHLPNFRLPKVSFVHRLASFL